MIVIEIIEYLKKLEGKGITRVYSSCLKIFGSDRNFYYDTFDGKEMRELEKNFNDKSKDIENPCTVEIEFTGTEYEPDYDDFF